jgi:DNA-binding CsgD family transcriptional regulator
MRPRHRASRLRASAPKSLNASGSRLVAHFIRQLAMSPGMDHAVSASALAGRPPLVGRDAELDQVTAALDRVVGGDGGVLLVSGEPGIGKTRLVEELSGLASAQGALVAWGRVDDVDGAPPYWPWIQLLESVLAGADRDVVTEALRDNAGPLGAILGAVGKDVTDAAPPAPLDPAAARFRLHRAVLDVLRRVGAHRPLVLLLDDLHWADASSLELTRFVARALSGFHVLLVATYRTVDAGDSELFDDVLGSLARHPTLQRVPLSGLSEAEVGRFMAQTIGLRPRRAAVAAVHARTEGNPFFAGELVRLLQSEGLLRPGTPQATGVPVGVRDVLRRRLAQLPAQANELLAIGSVLGRELDLAVLAASAELDELAVVDAIEPALSAGVITESGESTGRLRFSHALVRDTIYGELSALRRATLHARAADALERTQRSGAVHLAELASHFFHAAPVLGPDRGLTYLLQSADAAQSALAHEQAEADLQRALSLVELIASANQRVEQELHIQNRIAALLTTTRGHADPDVGRACARAQELSGQVQQSDELVATLASVANYHFVRCDHHTTAEVARQLLTIGEQRSDMLATTLGLLLTAGVQPYLGELAVGRTSMESAVSSGRRLALSIEMTRVFRQHPLPPALGYDARYAWMAGDIARARQSDDESIQLVHQLDHPYSLAFAYYMSTQLAVLMADAPRAELLADEAIARCNTGGFAMLGHWSAIFHGWAIAEQGRAEEGVAEITTALAGHTATGALMNTPLFLGLLSDAERRHGESERALALVDEAVQLARTTGDRIFEADLHRRRGELLAAEGPDRIAEAASALREAIAIAVAQGADSYRQRAETALDALGIAQPRPAVVPGRAAASSGLSPREREILALVGRGLTDKEIAAELVISLATVRSHLDRIRDKTGRRRRPDLSRLADELGLTMSLLREG